MTVMSSPASVRVIGIAGASNGGKTTLCNKIKSMDRWHETYTIIHMDDYYWPRDNPRHKMIASGTMINFDCMEAVDWDRLLADIHRELQSAKGQLKFIIVEGIFVCTHPEVSKLLHSKIFLELDYETMKFRRSQRQYLIPDEEGYFDEYVYPCYLETKTALEDEPQEGPVHFVPGSKTKEEVFNHVLDICHQLHEVKVSSTNGTQNNRMREVNVETS